MPVRRDADGNVIDELTRPAWQSEHAAPPTGDRRTADIAGATDFHGGAAPTTPRGGAEDAGRYGAPTTPARRREPESEAEASRTRVYRPERLDDPRAEDEAGPPDPMNDPPVGWLVIVDGPGRGRVVTLGMGVNSVGRDRKERVSLDYGDEMISRVNHGTITYDPRGRQFYLQPGRGTNLTYVDDEPVLAPRALEPFTHVQMGNTILRFVPLCGAEFSWEDKAEADDN